VLGSNGLLFNIMKPGSYRKYSLDLRVLILDSKK